MKKSWRSKPSPPTTLSSSARVPSSPDFNSDVFRGLSDSEKTSIISGFPSYENQVLFLASGNMNYKKDTYKYGLIVLTPHFITVYFQQSPGLKFQTLCFFHILTLQKIITESDLLGLEAEKEKVYMTTKDVFDFTHVLYMAFSLSTFIAEGGQKVQFIVEDDALYPMLPLPLSPSQLFQYRFAALSTFNGLPYNHEITKYFHSLILRNDPFFRLNRVPQNYVYSVLDTLIDIPIFKGIICKDYEMPSIFEGISPFLETYPDIRYIVLSNCKANSGLQNFTDALSTNESINLTHLDISSNDFPNLKPLIQILPKFSELRYLNVGNCSLNKTNCETLLSAIQSFDLDFLGIASAEFSEKSVKLFKALVKKSQNLTSLDISQIAPEYLAPLLQSLNYSNVKELSLSKCKFSPEAISSLRKIAPKFVSLDLSDCIFSPIDISFILTALGTESEEPVTIKLNRNNLSKDKLLPIIRGFLLSDLEKWSSIELNETKITPLELDTLQALFLRMPNLRSLSFVGCFKEDCVDSVSSLLEISSLKSLNLAHCKLSALVSDICGAKQLTSIDMSYNELTDADALALLSSQTLQYVNLDGNPANIKEVTKMNTPPEPVPEQSTIDNLTEALSKTVPTQHCAINEDYYMQYPFDGTFSSVETKLDDIELYHLKKANVLICEGGKYVNKPYQPIVNLKYANTVEGEMPESDLDQVQGLRPMEESIFSSDSSLDEMMNTNLIPALSDTMFTGLGGHLSDSSTSEEEVKMKKIHPDMSSDSAELLQSSLMEEKSPKRRIQKSSSSDTEPDFDSSVVETEAAIPRVPPPPLSDSDDEKSPKKKFSWDSSNAQQNIVYDPSKQMSSSDDEPSPRKRRQIKSPKRRTNHSEEEDEVRNTISRRATTRRDEEDSPRRSPTQRSPNNTFKRNKRQDDVPPPNSRRTVYKQSSEPNYFLSEESGDSLSRIRPINEQIDDKSVLSDSDDQKPFLEPIMEHKKPKKATRKKIPPPPHEETSPQFTPGLIPPLDRSQAKAAKNPTILAFSPPILGKSSKY